MRFLWILLSIMSVTSYSQSEQTIVIDGHRGCRGLLPENTMPGFYRALELGATALEIDLVCTADGRMLVSHDPYILSELCTYPDGSLIETEKENELNIYKMTLAEAQSYPCGTQPYPRFPEQQQQKSFKPSFQEFVEGVMGHCKSNGISMPLMNIEIKSQPDWDGIYQPEPEAYMDLFLKEFNSFPIREYALIQSFDPRVLEVLHKNDASLKLMYLVGGKNKDVKQNLSVLSFKPYSYNPHYSLVDAQVVEYCKTQGINLMVWTVNDEAEMKRLLSLGVNHLITDYPDKAMEQVKAFLKN
jgi:glycerophosphoryl diester phosphodiesterase